MSNGDCVAMRQMPQYRSHKKVWALKIAGVEIHKDKTATIAPADGGFAAFTTPDDWGNRFHGSDDDLGYYVQYEDGYTSWSPTKAFEDGYTLIQGDGKDA